MNATEEHKRNPILLGENAFRSGLLTVAPNTVVGDGVILQTTADGKFVVSAAGETETGLAVMIGTAENTSETSLDVAVRVCISGKINSAVLKIGTEAASATQADLLRKWSIVPVRVTDVNFEG